MGVPRTGFRRGLSDLYNFLDGELPAVVPPRAGSVYYVSNRSGGFGVAAGVDDVNHGTRDAPFATIDYAIGACTADRGDLILVGSGHAETISAASAITADVAGITIQGLGVGDDRPVLTFSTSTAATIVVSAANVAIRNIVGKCNIDQLVTAFSVTAAGCVLDIEWQDTATNKEALVCITGGTGADNLRAKLRYRGQTGGSHAVAAIKLNGTDEAVIELDAYGKWSTALVNFITTACTGVRVTGQAYNSGTTDGSKLVVDTITGSTWVAEILDGAAGVVFRGGSGLALTQTTGSLVPSADSTNNVVSADVVGNKTDATQQTVGTTRSLMAYIKGLMNALIGSGAATFPAAAAPANSVSIAAALRYISEYQVPRMATKQFATAGSQLTTGLSPVTAFTVSGKIKARVYGFVDTAITSTGATGTLALGVTGNTGAFIAATTADGTNFPTGSVWAGDTSPTLKSEVFTGTSLNWAPVNNTNIIVTIATNSMTAGDITLACEWTPINSSASLS